MANSKKAPLHVVGKTPTLADQLKEKRLQEEKEEHERKETARKWQEAQDIQKEADEKIAQALSDKEDEELNRIAQEEPAATEPVDITELEKAVKEDENKEEAFAKKPIADRIEKLHFLYSLTEKLVKLKATRFSLQKFQLSSDNAKDKIILTDGNGNEFQTYQKHIVAEVLNLIKFRVDEMIKNTENQIII